MTLPQARNIPSRNTSKATHQSRGRKRKPKKISRIKVPSNVRSAHPEISSSKRILTAYTVHTSTEMQSSREILTLPVHASV